MNRRRLVLILFSIVLVGTPFPMRASRTAKHLKRAIAHYQRGSELYAKGDVGGAIAEYRQALRLQPDEAYWHLGLGIALEKNGDRRAALEEYHLASDLSPNDPGLRSEYDKLLTELQKGEGPGIEPGKGAGLGPGSDGSGGGPYAAGGNVSAPVPTHQPMPRYSEKARKAKYRGTVVLWIVVTARGDVTDVRVMRPLGLGLDQRAIEAVRTWRFQPGTRNGLAVPVLMSVEVMFRLI